MPAPRTTPTSRSCPGTAAIVLVAARHAAVGRRRRRRASALAILTRQSWLLGVVPACASASVCTVAGATSCRSWRQRRAHRRHHRLLRAVRQVLGMERDQQSRLRVRQHQHLVSARTRAGVGCRVRRLPPRRRRWPPASAPWQRVAAIRRRSLPDDVDLWVWVASGARGVGRGTAVLRSLLAAGRAAAGAARRAGRRQAGPGAPDGWP